MIQRLAARLRRLERDGELLLGLGLPDELGQPLGPQLQLDGVIIIDVPRRNQPLGQSDVRRAVDVDRDLRPAADDGARRDAQQVVRAAFRICDREPARGVARECFPAEDRRKL